MAQEGRNSYVNIFKAMGLFGGVKIFQILANLVKAKIVAVLLGPLGMGIQGMINSTTSLISSLTGFGLRTSSVRDVSIAYSSGNTDKWEIIVAVLRKIVFITGLLGLIVTFLFAPFLSKWAFGNDEYINAFRIVSIVLLFDQLSIGQTVLMQGTFHYKYIASSSLLGSIVGLVLSVPLYYFWREKAIVPVIIISSFLNLFFTWYYSKKILIRNKKVSLKEAVSYGRIMLIMGFSIAVVGFISSGQIYLMRTFISNIGSLADVGLYTAGVSIATSYIDVVLSSMGSDYSPRLAAVSSEKEQFIDTINRQMLLLVTVLAPLIMLFIVFIRPITILLFSEQFLPVSGMIEWMMLGMYIRAISWCFSYCYIARGESKTYLAIEIVANVITLLFAILGYKLLRFTGTGIAFCVTYLVYASLLYCISSIRFDYKIDGSIVKPIIIQVSITILGFTVLRLIGYTFFRYVIGVIFLFVQAVFSYRKLDSLINISSTIKRKLYNN